MPKDIAKKDSEEISIYKQAYLDMIRKNVEQKPIPERTAVNQHLRRKSDGNSQKR